MEFRRRARAVSHPSRLGILSGAFNPPTVAHLALAEAALASTEVDEVVFVLPRSLPHKDFAGASPGQRLDMLVAACTDPAFSVAETDGGLFVEIAGECRAVYGDAVRLRFLCGRDAAERIVNWDYGHPAAFERMLTRFDLLVAARCGEYEPPPEFRNSIRPLALPADFNDVSGSEIRARIARGEPWEQFVPAEIRDRVREIYPVTSPTGG